MASTPPLFGLNPQTFRIDTWERVDFLITHVDMGCGSIERLKLTSILSGVTPKSLLEGDL